MEKGASQAKSQFATDFYLRNKKITEVLKPIISPIKGEFKFPSLDTLF